MTIMETMHKIQTLEKLINLGTEDGLIDKTLSKLIQYKTNKMERELQELEDSMKKFESKYNMDTETFYKTQVSHPKIKTAIVRLHASKISAICWS